LWRIEVQFDFAGQLIKGCTQRGGALVFGYNEQETRFFLIDLVLREKGYSDYQWIKMEPSAPVEPTGPKGRRRKGAGRTDYLLCVQVGAMPKPHPKGAGGEKRPGRRPG
jgi:type I restriction enzyme R subunit